MRIVVGQHLKYRGKLFQVSSIEQKEWTHIAGIDSAEELRRIEDSGDTHEYLKTSIDPFEVNDIVTSKTHTIMLRPITTGSTWLTLVLDISITKEDYLNGQQRTDSSNQQATAGSPQGSGDGPQDRNSVGDTGLNTADRSLHGDRSNQEGGVVGIHEVVGGVQQAKAEHGGDSAVGGGNNPGLDSSPRAGDGVASAGGLHGDVR